MSIHSLLQPLVTALPPAETLCCRPHEVRLGQTLLDISWSEQQHQEVLDLVSHSEVLPEGVIVERFDTTLYLQKPPLSFTPADLVANQWLSDLAAKTLDATLHTGRNILVIGPQPAAIQFIAAFLHAEKTVVGSSTCAIPTDFWRFSEVRQARLSLVKRLGYWDTNDEVLIELLRQNSGVMAYFNAPRIDKALICFEALLEKTTRNTALQVLACLDTLVLLDEQKQVQAIVEIEISQNGYHLRPLFGRQNVKNLQMLVPLAAPSFVEELPQLLAQDLLHAAPKNQAPMPAAAPKPTSIKSPATLTKKPEIQPSIEYEMREPGWELDQLSDTFITETLEISEEEAELTASDGLGPPPRVVK